jgi:hypothetical protein
MNTMHPLEDENPRRGGWPEYAAWTVAISFGTALATKLGEWVADECRRRAAARKQAIKRGDKS